MSAKVISGSGRVLGRHRASVADVLKYARSLPARDAAAVVTEAVRVVDDLDEDQAPVVLELAHLPAASTN